jgi:predicted metalloprotease
VRLDDFDPDNVDVGDQRGRGGFPGLGGGGQGFSVGPGGLGLGTIVLLMAGAWVLGINPLSVLGLAGGNHASTTTGSAPVASGSDAASSCNVDKVSHESCNALASLNTTWSTMFAAAGHPFSRPRLCSIHAMAIGLRRGASAMGPFYCPPITVSISTPISTAKWTRNWVPGPVRPALCHRP